MRSRVRRPNHTGTTFVTLLASALLPAVSLGADWPDDGDWAPILRTSGQALSDPEGDAPFGGSNCVGDLTGAADGTARPAASWWVDPDTVFFRIRLDRDPFDPANITVGTWSVLIDIDGTDTNWDYRYSFSRTDEAEPDLSAYFFTNGTIETGYPDWQDPWDPPIERITSEGLWRTVVITDDTAPFNGTNDAYFDIQVPRSTFMSFLALEDAENFRLAFATGGADLVYESGLDEDLCGGSFDATLTGVLSERVTLDSDGDGLSSTEEWKYGTDPTLTDTDGDGVSDADEVRTLLTNPTLADTDGDGLQDGDEAGVGTDPLVADTDGDHVLDGDEVEYGTSPLLRDTDGDGLSDEDEYLCNDDPASDPDDRDGDGRPDAEEGTGDFDVDGRPSFCDEDDDGDGLDTKDEPACGTDPDVPDTDGDGILDGVESCTDDSDGDGIVDVLDPVDNPTGGTEGSADQGLAALSGGRLAGGACSSLALGPTLLPAFFAAFAAALRRRRMAGLVASGAAASMVNPALAQELNGQTFRPAIGEDDFVRVDDTQTGSAAGGGSIWFNHAASPLVYRYDSGDEVDILESVGSLNLQGWGALGPARLGLDLPIHPYVAGFGIDGQTSTHLGDLLADARIEIVDRKPGGVGFAVGAGLGFPTGDGAAWLGDPGLSLHLRAIGSAELGPVLVAANVGFRGRPVEVLPDDTVWGHRVPWGIGARIPFSERLLAAAEITGEAFVGTVSDGYGFPVEAIGTLRYNASPQWSVITGGGTGITSGLGAPDWRALAGIQGRFGRTPTTASSETPKGTGVASEIRVVSGEGRNAVGGATLELRAGPKVVGTFTVPPDTGLSLSLEAGGSYEMTVRAPGHQDLSGFLEVPNTPGKDWQTEIRLSPTARRCSVRLEVRDTQGNPLLADVRVVGNGPGPTRTQANTGAAELELMPGDAFELVIAAVGFSPDHRAIACSTGPNGEVQNITREIVLQPPRARLTGDRIAIDDKILFETDADRIDARSKGILDDVASILLANPTLALVEVRGHTDSRGSETYNLELSKARAASVARYLVQAGVDASRLRPIGLGESVPLVQGDSEAAHDANRRVEFLVVEQRTP